jgi:hypothetical protein
MDRDREQGLLLAHGRAWAAAYGYRGSVGGWIRRSDGVAVCQGWLLFGLLLADRGLIGPEGPYARDASGARLDAPRLATVTEVQASALLRQMLGGGEVWRRLPDRPATVTVLAEYAAARRG